MYATSNGAAMHQVAELVDDANKHLKSERTAAHAYDTAMKFNRMLPTFGKREAESITRQEVLDWLDEQAEEHEWSDTTRNRYVAAMRVVEANPLEKKLPAPPAEVATLFAACGKVRKTVQMPMALAEASVQSAAATQTDRLEKREAIRSVVREYRAKIPGMLEMLPHDLPDLLGEAGTHPAFETSGSMARQDKTLVPRQ